MKFRRLLLALFALAGSAAAQFTTVTGTVTDPTGIPYANGTIYPTLVIPSGAGSPTLSGASYSPPSQSTSLDINGSFTIRLADNTVLLPASTKWNFQVCSSSGTVNPSIGKGPVCFSLASPITISGSSQSISSNLNAVALALTVLSSGTIAGSIAANQIAVGSAANTIQGFSAFTATTPAASITNGAEVLGTIGTTGGQLCLAGATSGSSCITPSAVAATSTNPFTFGNTIDAPDGTQNSPSFSFTNQTNTGFYRSGSNIIATVSGTRSAGISSAIGITLPATFWLAWANASDPTVAVSTTINQASTEVLKLGNNGDSTGMWQAAGYIAAGAKFTASGCTNSSLVGGSTAGTFTVGQNTACTIVITMGSATSLNGWTCTAYDQTGVPAVAIRQTASTTTSCSLLMTVATNDVITFSAIGF